MTESQWLIAWLVVAEPVKLYDCAPNRDGPLLILAREVVFSDGASDGCQRFERLALRVQSHALPAREPLSPKNVLDRKVFVLLGDRRKGEDFPSSLLKNMPDQIVLVKPLHHN